MVISVPYSPRRFLVYMHRLFLLVGVTETINVSNALLISQGDEILAVNGVDVKGKSAFEVSSSIQGPNETVVTITVVI